MDIISVCSPFAISDCHFKINIITKTNPSSDQSNDPVVSNTQINS